MGAGVKEKRTIRLSGPAKIGPDWHQVGAVIEVDDDTHRQLEAAGVIASAPEAVEFPELGAMIHVARDDLDRAVAAQAQAIAEAMVAAAVEAALAGVIGERDAAQARATAAETALADLRAQSTGVTVTVSREVPTAPAKRTAVKAAKG